MSRKEFKVNRKITAGREGSDDSVSFAIAIVAAVTGGLALLGVLIISMN